MRVGSSSAETGRRLLRLYVQGLQIDAECGEGGVVHLSTRADEQHKSPLGRLRQHLAHALFRIGRLCHPSNQHDAIRVIELHVPPAPIDDAAAWLRECHVIQRRPTKGANGETHYETLVIHEGVQSHQDRLTAFHHFFRGSRQEAADDAHALSSIQSAATCSKAVLYGPQGSGKTLLAGPLCAALGLRRIVDEWDGLTPLRPGDLAITNNAAPLESPCESMPRSLWRDSAALLGMALMLLIVVLASLSGCGGGDPEDDNAPPCVVDGIPRQPDVCR